jgi:hypothetical protein
MRTKDVENIELTMPAQPELLVLARLHAGAAGGLLDLNVDEIDDLRLAVEELCLWALDQRLTKKELLRVVFSWSGDAIEASCRLLGEDGAPIPREEHAATGPSALSERILDALVTEHGLTEEDGSWAAWFRKSRPTT